MSTKAAIYLQPQLRDRDLTMNFEKGQYCAELPSGDPWLALPRASWFQVFFALVKVNLCELRRQSVDTVETGATVVIADFSTLMTVVSRIADD